MPSPLPPPPRGEALHGWGDSPHAGAHLGAFLIRSDTAEAMDPRLPRDLLAGSVRQKALQRSELAHDHVHHGRHLLDAGDALDRAALQAPAGEQQRLGAGEGRWRS